MTREQAKQKLIDLGIAEPTEKQISDLLDSVTSETKAEKARADKYKADADKAKELEEKVAELENQNLTDAEKQQKENEALQKQIKDLTESNYKTEAKAILAKAGISDEDMEALLPGMIADTLENTQARANAYVSAMNKSIEAAIKNREKEDLDGTGTPGSGDGGNEDKSSAEIIASKLFSGSKKQENSILSHYVNGGN